MTVLQSILTFVAFVLTLGTVREVILGYIGNQISSDTTEADSQ